jgi:hypothetical protein
MSLQKFLLKYAGKEGLRKDIIMNPKKSAAIAAALLVSSAELSTYDKDGKLVKKRKVWEK